VSDLRRSLERQASYLIDVVSPDARRRRSRQKVRDRFEAARRLVQSQIERKSIAVENQIAEEIRTQPMFSAELTSVLANLLTNAVKATEEGGRIQARAFDDGLGLTVRIQNTGVSVDLASAERWFAPFESTTTTVDPVLGQGMGLGLPITRRILEEYGAAIRFVAPAPGFSTAVEIKFRA
jgi:signal transduction histidine kinase